MYILKKELKTGIKNFIIWSVIIATFLLIAMFEFKSINKDMDDIMKMFPKEILIVLGINPEISMATTIGYYAMLNFYLLIALIFFSIGQGNKAVSREVIDKTHEFLFIKPLSRNKILLDKILSSVIYIFCINVIVMFMSLLSSLMVEDVSNALWLFFITNLLISYLFLAISCFLNAYLERINKSSQLCYLILLITFIFSIIFDFFEIGSYIQFLTPLKYFEAAKLIELKISPLYLVITLLLTSVLTFLTFYFYKKKDLKVI